jgi:hypothetical protein
MRFCCVFLKKRSGETTESNEENDSQTIAMMARRAQAQQSPTHQRRVENHGPNPPPHRPTPDVTTATEMRFCCAFFEKAPRRNNSKQ